MQFSVDVRLPGQHCHQALRNVNCWNRLGNRETTDRRAQGLQDICSTTVFFLHFCGPRRVHDSVIQPYPSLLFLSDHPEQQYKVEVYQQQIDMEKLCHQGELLLKKVSDQTDRDMIQEPLTELRHLWDNLGDKITQRQVLFMLKRRIVKFFCEPGFKNNPFFFQSSCSLLFFLEKLHVSLP